MTPNVATVPVASALSAEEREARRARVMSRVKKMNRKLSEMTSALDEGAEDVYSSGLLSPCSSYGEQRRSSLKGSYYCASSCKSPRSVSFDCELDMAFYCSEGESSECSSEARINLTSAIRLTLEALTSRQ